MRMFALVLAATVAASPTANAAFLLQYNGMGQHKDSLDLSYSYKGTDNAWHSGSLNNIHTGEMWMTAVGQGAGGVNLAFKTFCIDLFHVMTSSYMVNVTPLTTQPGANGSPAVAPMGGWLGGGMAHLYDKYLGLSTPSANTAAGYQLAIWRLTLGANASLSSDNGTVNAIADVLYADALNNLGASGSWLSKVNGADGQNVLYPDQPTPVPAPGAMVLLASGGLFFGAFRSRRFAKKLAA